MPDPLSGLTFLVLVLAAIFANKALGQDARIDRVEEDARKLLDRVWRLETARHDDVLEEIRDLSE